jgi:D-alanyl-D-alanine dipeptidase
MQYDEAARIAFWVEYMERSYALSMAIIAHPLAECSEGFASIPAAMADARAEVLFSDTRLAGQYERLFYIRASLIPPLVAIARKMNARGWVLKIEDAYRTRAMQTALGRAPAVFDRIVQTCVRECGGQRPPVELVYRRAMCLVANVPLTGTHLAGAAVDISVLRRDDGREIWRGKPYLEMSEYTPMDSPFISAEERENRVAITEVMEQHNFLHYPGEFWHYNSQDSLYQIQVGLGQPGRYGPVDWDARTNTVTPFADPTALLTPYDLLEQLIEDSMKRVDVGLTVKPTNAKRAKR